MQIFHARRQFFRATVGSLGGAALARANLSYALPVRAKKPVSSSNWRLVVNEAVTGESNSFVLTNRYRTLADFLAIQLRGRVVSVEPMVDISRFISVAQAEVKPELVFGKTVNQLAKLVRDHGYQPIVKRSDPYKAAFVVGKDSPINNMAEAANFKIIMPDVLAASSVIAMAELRRQNIRAGSVTNVKFQEEVIFYLRNGLGQVGLVNPTTAKKWQEEGGRVLAETQPVVNWSLLAAPSVSAEIVLQLREALLASTTEATAVLGSIGVKAWAKAELVDYTHLLNYIKE